uniref:Uncharacterized protein n=1 Tax=Oryza barthii TaxID=65489 RepID=A0A0D3G3C7_9ORYZ
MRHHRSSRLRTVTFAPLDSWRHPPLNLRSISPKHRRSTISTGNPNRAAVLLRLHPDWDWFITLNAADYPVVTQDERLICETLHSSRLIKNISQLYYKHVFLLLSFLSKWTYFYANLIYVLSNVSRQFNFVDHTSDIGQKESEKVQSMIVDAGIYLAGRTNFFRASEKRPTPDAFKFFTGISCCLCFCFGSWDSSPWVILNRQFIEYCILGWENLPRILLMYFNNIMLPQEGYFHSVICNSLEFRNFTVNNDLRYKAWDNPPQTEPVFLDMTHYDKMVDSGAPFARRFRENESLLDKIDGNVLGRWGHGPVPGAWCSGRKSWFSDPCSQWSDVNIVRPGPQGIKLRQYINRALEEGEFGSKSCRR